MLGDGAIAEYMKRKRLGRILREAREASGLNQAQASRLAGFLSTGSLWRIEHDQMRPSLETLLKLAKLYGIEVRFGEERLSGDG